MGAARAASTTSTSSAASVIDSSCVVYPSDRISRSYSPGRSRSSYDPSAPVCADRPLSSASTTAPSIGWPSFAGHGAGHQAGRDLGEPIGRLAREDVGEVAELQRIGPVGVLDADAGVLAGAGLVVEQVDVAVLPQLHLEAARAVPGLHGVVRKDEGAVRRGADGLELDRAIGVNVEVLPERIDRRVRMDSDGISIGKLLNWSGPRKFR